MQLYTGRRTVKAKRMTSSEYHAFIDARSFAEKRAVDKDSKVGYLIGYPDIDGKTFNGVLMEGCHYTSWCPESIFLKEYILSPDH